MFPCIHFKFDIEKFVNVVAYFASKGVPDLTKLKVSKLLYFSDKLHLQKYGRPITGDDYYALPKGPIPTVSLNIMSDAGSIEPSFGTPDSNIKLFLTYLSVDRSKKHPSFKIKKNPDLDVFSDSEIEVLDEIIKTFGSASLTYLLNKAHEEVGYKKTYDKRPNGEIDFRLFFEGMDENQKKSLIELVEHDQEDREAFELSR